MRPDHYSHGLDNGDKLLKVKFQNVVATVCDQLLQARDVLQELSLKIRVCWPYHVHDLLGKWPKFSDDKGDEDM
jgi:hypothetical protein